MDVFSSHRTDGGVTLDPATTALVVVDMINDFCKSGGAMVLPGYERLVPYQLRVIDAARQIARERAQSFLKPEHQKRILTAYDAFGAEPGFAAVVPNDDVLANDGTLSILRYVPRIAHAGTDAQIGGDLREAWTDFDAGSEAFWSEMEDVVAMVERIDAESRTDG